MKRQGSSQPGTNAPHPEMLGHGGWRRAIQGCSAVSALSSVAALYTMCLFRLQCFLTADPRIPAAISAAIVPVAVLVICVSGLSVPASLAVKRPALRVQVTLSTLAGAVVLGLAAAAFASTSADDSARVSWLSMTYGSRKYFADSVANLSVAVRESVTIACALGMTAGIALLAAGGAGLGLAMQLE